MNWGLQGALYSLFNYMRIFIHSVVFFIVLISCASKKEGWLLPSKTHSKMRTETFKSTQSTKSVTSLRNEALFYWSKRDETESLKKALNIFERLHSLEPQNVEILVYLTRGYYFLGDAHTDHYKIKKKIFEKAITYGEFALATNKEFISKIQEKKKIDLALESMTVKDVPAMYWTAASLGKWVKVSGIAATLKYKSRIKALIQRVEKLSPSYFHSAIHRYWGAYYSINPSYAGGDLKRARKEFETSISKSPEYLGSKVLMAEAYWSKVGDKERFKKLLNEVIEEPLREGSPLAPENYWEKVKAKKLLKNMGDYFKE